MTQPLLPKWVTDQMAGQAERSADRIERTFGHFGSLDSVAELREIAADLRAINAPET